MLSFSKTVVMVWFEQAEMYVFFLGGATLSLLNVTGRTEDSFVSCF